MKVTALATRTEKWWVVEIPEVEGAFTQAKRLDQVADMAADVVALLTDVSYDSVEVDVRPVINDDLDNALSDCKEASTAATTAQHRAGEVTRAAVHKLRESGLSVRDAGFLLGISPQRVSQLEAPRFVTK